MVVGLCHGCRVTLVEWWWVCVMVAGCHWLNGGGFVSWLQCDIG